MSKYINVNPDHYKVAGRERPTTIAANTPRPKPKEDAQARARWEKKLKQVQRADAISPKP